MNAYESAQMAVGLVGRREWFDEPHADGAPTPTCCEATACVEATLRAVGRWSDADSIALARAVAEGMDAAC